jgi:hypothetical protein
MEPAGIEQYSFGGSRLPSVNMGHDAYVSNRIQIGFVSHLKTPAAYQR